MLNKKAAPVLLALLCAVLVLSGCAATTPSFPTKNITMIVPYTAGGSADLLARTMEKPAFKQFGQSLVITNLPGGGGTLAWNELAGSKPDGYTLGITAFGLILQPLYGDTRYHYATALDPIAQLASYPVLLAVRADQPWQNINDFIQYAKKHPGEIKFGHGGLGASQHLFGEIFAKEAGIDIVQVPFRGDSEALAALLGGHIQIAFMAPTALKEHVKSGSVKILAVSSEQRLTDPTLATVSTFREQGVNLVFQIWFGVGAPKQLPPEVKQRLEASFKNIINDPEFKKNVDNLGLTVDYLDSKQSTVKWIEQNDTMSKFLKESGIDEKVNAQKN